MIGIGSEKNQGLRKKPLLIFVGAARFELATPTTPK